MSELQRVEASELYYNRIRESAVRRDVRKGVKSEVRGIEGWRWNWVSPDSIRLCHFDQHSCTEISHLC